MTADRPAPADLLRSAAGKINPKLARTPKAPRSPKPVRPVRSNTVSVTFTGQVVYVGKKGNYLVIKDANGVETPLSWLGEAPQIVIHPQEPTP